MVTLLWTIFCSQESLWRSSCFLTHSENDKRAGCWRRIKYPLLISLYWRWNESWISPLNALRQSHILQRNLMLRFNGEITASRGWALNVRQQLSKYTCEKVPDDGPFQSFLPRCLHAFVPPSAPSMLLQMDASRTWWILRHNNFWDMTASIYDGRFAGEGGRPFSLNDANIIQI